MTYFIVVIWSLLISICELCLRIAGLFNQKIRTAIRGRFRPPLVGKQVEFLFFCSSAGEYEQALPLINRLRDKEVVIIFFSTSGYLYAQKRGEPRPYLLAPFDTLWAWQRIFRSLNPRAVIIVRHEFWPAFLYVARKQAQKLFLINASLTSVHIGFLKRIFLACFDHIFLVKEADAALFHKSLPHTALSMTGDSKFDRVFERAAGRQKPSWEPALAPFLSCRARLILGSAWPADTFLVLGGVCSVQPFSLGLVIAPHNVDAKSLAGVLAAVAAHGKRAKLFSQVVAGAVSYEVSDVLVVDVIGSLAEIYALANLAYVGGGMHHKVHNVLEPAVYGLSVAFGPHYHNSYEAEILLAKNAASVIASPEALREWMAKEVASGCQSGKNAAAELQAAKGASDRICQIICAED